MGDLGARQAPSQMLPNNERAPSASVEVAPSSEACLGSAVAVCPASAGAAVSPASAVAAVPVFAAFAAFVAGGAALPAAFSPHRLSVVPLAGLPGPAFAGASVVPVPVSRIASLAAAGTSDPASGCLYLEDRDVQLGEGRGDGQAGWVEKPCCLDGCCSLDGSPNR